MFNLPITRLLIAGVLISIIGLTLSTDQETANITITATSHNPQVYEQFSVTLLINAEEPVNVFKGILEYDPAALKIIAIDYNTSVADLWAELPWYSNGDGTLTFTGGTTRHGGFTGNDQLITVTFEALTAGQTPLHMRDVRILRHDGLGTDAPVPKPIDTIFTITPEILKSEIVAENALVKGPSIKVLAPTDALDLNSDGKHSIADSSIFMVHLTTQNLRSDFNHDGVVDLKDLSILNQ